MPRRQSSSEAAAITRTDVTYGRREAVDQTDRDAFVAAAPRRRFLASVQKGTTRPYALCSSARAGSLSRTLLLNTAPGPPERPVRVLLDT